MPVTPSSSAQEIHSPAGTVRSAAFGLLQRDRQRRRARPNGFSEGSGALREAGVQVDGTLFVSNRAQVILPYHRMIELASENAPAA